MKFMKKALLVIDVQNEYFTGKLPVTYPANSFENILKAIDFSIENKIPVIAVQHTASTPESPVFRKASKEWELHDEIRKRPFDKLIEKKLPGTFSGTDLENYLKKNNIKELIISGYMTQMCCDTTSRQAFHMGYSVKFLSDATGTLAISNDAGTVTAEELHRAILVTQAMRFAKVMKTDDWINSL